MLSTVHCCRLREFHNVVHVGSFVSSHMFHIVHVVPHVPHGALEGCDLGVGVGGLALERPSGSK